MYKYTFDTANRLISVSDPHTLISYEYNGLGDRYSQTVDGERTDYALDLALGLTQVLSDSERIYLYGYDRIAQYDIDNTEYFLGDALSSMRQLTDEDGKFTLAKNYKPYGEELSRSGISYSLYGFTGEVYDEAAKLIYLRARYYSPWKGRFMSRDVWSGNFAKPMSYNVWLNTNNNPTNYTDPSGNSPFLFAKCFSLHTLLQGNVSISAGEAVRICEHAFDKNSWGAIFNCNDQCHKPETVTELFREYICETGDAFVYLQGTNPLTQELANSALVDLRIRAQYYQTGSQQTSFLPFNEAEFAIGWLDQRIWSWIPVTQFLGSFWYTVVELPENRIGFRIDNNTTLASGTHFPGRFPPLYNQSVEEIIHKYPELEGESLNRIVNEHRVISILQSKTRQRTSGTAGGGTMWQTFVWTERKLPCPDDRLLARFFPSLLDIDEWTNFSSYTTPPSPGLE